MEEFRETRDLWFASFLKLKGYEVKDFIRINEGKKGKFQFAISDTDWKELKLEFDKSDISKVKYFQEQLKDLVY